MIHEYYTPEIFFIKNEAYAKFPKEFDDLLELFVQSETIKDTLSEIKMYTAEQKACSLIFLKSQNLVISILKICNEGIAEVAGILLRSIYENYIQTKYIIQSDSGDQFLKYRAASLKKYTDSYESKFPESKLLTPEYRAFKKNLNKAFEEIKENYLNEKGEIRERWNKLGIKGMAKATDEMLSYDYIMTIYSAFVHCDVTGMAHYTIETEDNITFDNSPSPDKVDEVLKLSYEFFGRITTELVGLYRIEVPPPFARFLKTK